MSKNVQSAIAAAKKRMKSGYWVQRAGNVTTGIKQDERIDKMYVVVKDMLESGEIVTNPLARLMDIDEYNILDEVQKSSYVLELASIYRELKQRYYTSQPKAN